MCARAWYRSAALARRRSLKVRGKHARGLGASLAHLLKAQLCRKEGVDVVVDALHPLVAAWPWRASGYDVVAVV